MPLTTVIKYILRGVQFDVCRDGKSFSEVEAINGIKAYRSILKKMRAFLKR